MKLEPVRLKSVIDGVQTLLQAEMEDANAEKKGTLPTVQGDRVPRKKDNVPPRVRIQATRLGRQWLISFEDNGIGIDPAHHGRIFVPLQRLHGREIPGTGIGPFDVPPNR